MKLLPLLALATPALLANALFTAPTGCTALAPAPDASGVQCFGLFSGVPTTVAVFSGTGSGSLFATSVLFEWDFTTFGFPARVVNIAASVNGRTDFRQEITFSASQRHTGSFTLPVTFGETLNTWQLSVDSASTNIDIPTTGVGLRLLVNHTPPSSAIPEPATGTILALGLAALAFLPRRPLPLLALLLTPLTLLPAGAIFTAPSGCTALDPAPSVTGVQCFGSFAQPDPAQPLSAQFSGGGSGPLWATSATFDYDFFTSSLITRAIGITAFVNGSSNSTVFLATLGSQQHTGSLTIPLTFGETLNSWNFLVSLTTATSDGSRTIDIPTSGVGLLLLVNHAPPSTAVPEPATAGLLALGGTALLLRRAKRLLLLPLIALAPLAAAPLFTAPAGCTAIQPAPNGEGVVCYGDTGLVRGTPQLSFAGSGTGPLWASEVVFQWDFEVGGGGGNIVLGQALVNGEPGFASYGLTFDFTTPYSGSLSIPYVPGTVLSSWSILVSAIPNTLIGGDSRSLATPRGGLGLRLLAVNQPPGAVPEPGTWVFGVATALWVLVRAGRKR